MSIPLHKGRKHSKLLTLLSFTQIHTPNKHQTLHRRVFHPLQTQLQDENFSLSLINLISQFQGNILLTLHDTYYCITHKYQLQLKNNVTFLVFQRSKRQSWSSEWHNTNHYWQCTSSNTLTILTVRRSF